MGQSIALGESSRRTPRRRCGWRSPRRSRHTTGAVSWRGMRRSRPRNGLGSAPRSPAAGSRSATDGRRWTPASWPGSWPGSRGRAHAAVAGYDLTFSPVKSVSTLWALAPRDVARADRARHTPRSPTPWLAGARGRLHPRRRRRRPAGAGDAGWSPRRSPTATPAPATRTCTPTSPSRTRCRRPDAARGWPWTGGCSSRRMSRPPSSTTPASRPSSPRRLGVRFIDRPGDDRGSGRSGRSTASTRLLASGPGGGSPSRPGSDGWLSSSRTTTAAADPVEKQCARAAGDPGDPRRQARAPVGGRAAGGLACRGRSTCSGAVA